MKRLRYLSHSLALLAVTSLSLCPAVVPVLHAETITTSTVDVTADNLAEIIAGLGSSDIEVIQARYTELQELIATHKANLSSLEDGEEKTELTEYIAQLETLEDAFEAIIEAYEAENADTVTSTVTTTNSDGSTTTRVTYADGSYTETTTPAEDDEDESDDASDESSDSSSGSSIGDILSQLMQNPAVQSLVTSLLQKLLNGGLGSLDSILSGLTGNTTTPNGDTLVGKVCTKGNTTNCVASDYATPNPTEGSAGTTTTSPNSSGSPDDRDQN